MKKKKEFKVLTQKFKKPIKTSNGLWKFRESIVLRQTEENGKSSYGEVAPTPGFNSHKIKDLEQEAKKWQETDACSEFPTLMTAITCLQSSLWGKDQFSQETLTSRLFLDYDKVEEDNQTIKKKIGIESTKIEISKTLDWFEKMPDSTKVRLDPNQSLNTDDLLRWIEAFLGNPKLDFIEQPLLGLPTDNFMELIEETNFPVALDEAVVSCGGPSILKKLGWNGIFVIKPTLLPDWMETIDFVLENPKKSVISSVFESRFGYEAVLRLSGFSELVAGIDRSNISEVTEGLNPTSNSFAVKPYSPSHLDKFWQLF